MYCKYFVINYSSSEKHQTFTHKKEFSTGGQIYVEIPPVKIISLNFRGRADLGGLLETKKCCFVCFTQRSAFRKINVFVKLIDGSTKKIIIKIWNKQPPIAW